MSFEITYETISLADLPAIAAQRKEDGWRYVQTLAVTTEEGVDLTYSFMKDALLENLQIIGVTKEDEVPSISDQFLAAFVFENEIHDLFGTNIKDIAIDFGGNFYALTVQEPMTIISPEKLAAREKAKKIAAAKAAKEAQQAAAKAEPAADQDAELEAKLAGMDPEKAAKVRAAMEAKAKKAAEKAAADEAAAKEAELEAKLAGMDPEKAAKVRAAMEAKAKKEAAQAAAEKEGE